MLREHDNVSQHPGEAPRRWFGDSYFDLIVWYVPDAPDQVLGFQLCYDKNHDEHALTWKRRSGFTHHAVDDGEDALLSEQSKQTPILVPDGFIDVHDLRRRFAEASGELDPAVTRLVLERLDEAAGSMPKAP